MANPWKKRALEYNRIRAEREGRLNDMDVIVGALLTLPPGQLKKVLSDEVLAVLAKYGYGEVQ